MEFSVSISVLQSLLAATKGFELYLHMIRSLIATKKTLKLKQQSKNTTSSADVKYNRFKWSAQAKSDEFERYGRVYNVHTKKKIQHRHQMNEKNAHDGIIVTFFYNLVITFDHV